MEWLEQNIDGYRIVAEILTALRRALYRDLEGRHGKDWHTAAIPKAVFDRMVERKEKETAVDWYGGDYQELVDFATFQDILEIIVHNPGTLPQLSRLAPGKELVHARFLELEAMRSKLSVARPISEAELSFLGTFHLRFRRAMEEMERAAAQALADTDEQRVVVEVQDETPETGHPATPPAPTPKPAAQAPVTPPAPAPKAAQSPPPASSAPAPVAAPRAVAAAAPAQPLAPPEDMVEADTGRPPTTNDSPQTAQTPPNARPPAAKKAKPAGIQAALDGNDHKGVLRELYREVTAIAEGIWASDVPPPPNVWDVVRVNDWYTANFSKLGLQPLSDFYGIITQVEEKMREGIARDELQEFLKTANFAKVLLSLRDMFQKNQI